MYNLEKLFIRLADTNVLRNMGEHDRTAESPWLLAHAERARGKTVADIWRESDCEGLTWLAERLHFTGNRAISRLLLVRIATACARYAVSQCLPAAEVAAANKYLVKLQAKYAAKVDDARVEVRVAPPEDYVQKAVAKKWEAGIDGLRKKTRSWLLAESATYTAVNCAATAVQEPKGLGQHALAVMYAEDALSSLELYTPQHRRAGNLRRHARTLSEIIRTCLPLSTLSRAVELAGKMRAGRR